MRISAKTHQRIMEIAASSASLAAQALGTTTMPGAVIGAAGIIVWIALTIKTKMWGLMPLNIASACICVWILTGLVHLH